jgi:predicted transcriptional regulator with HTH domain
MVEEIFLGKFEIIFSYVQEVSSQVGASPSNIQESVEQVLNRVQSSHHNEEGSRQQHYK